MTTPSTRRTPVSASAPGTRWSPPCAASSASSPEPPTSTPQNPADSKVSLTIDANSIDTGNAQRNGHLLSADFFETESNPHITFESTDVSRDGDDWTITGDLTIKGVSKPVTIEFEFTGSAKDPFGNDRIGFEGKAAISRKDWGLTYNAALETGGVLVSDKIKLDFDVSAIRNA